MRLWSIFPKWCWSPFVPLADSVVPLSKKRTSRNSIFGKKAIDATPRKVPFRRDVMGLASSVATVKAAKVKEDLLLLKEKENLGRGRFWLTAGVVAFARWITNHRHLEDDVQREAVAHIAVSVVTRDGKGVIDPDLPDVEDLLPEDERVWKTGKNAGVKRRQLPRRKVHKREFMESLVLEARVEFPFSLTPRTETNILGLHRFFASRLSELGVKKSQVGSYTVLAVESYFVPREIDVVAKNLTASSIAVQAKARYDATIVQKWWQVLVPFWVSRPLPVLKG